MGEDLCVSVGVTVLNMSAGVTTSANECECE